MFMIIIWDLDLDMINVMFLGKHGVVKILSKILKNNIGKFSSWP